MALQVIKVNDLQMAYRERGDGTTVVSLHAATVSSAELGWLTRILVHEGFNVVSPDIRGHGETHNPAPDLHLTRLVDDLLEFIYQIGRTAVHAIGYSLGGAVMLYAAQRRPEMFRSLVMMGSNYRAPSQGKLAQILGPMARRPLIQQQVFHPETGVVVGWDKSLIDFRGISAPTLLITGDRDEFNDPEDNLALYHVLPNAEALIVPRADHLGLVRHPIVTQALLEFYGRVPR